MNKYTLTHNSSQSVQSNSADFSPEFLNRRVSSVTTMNQLYITILDASLIV